VATLEREAVWKAQEVQNDVIQLGVDIDSELSEKGWPGVPADAILPSPLPGTPLHANGWPSVKGGVEVFIEVCSEVVEPEKECSTCRSLMVIDCLSVPDLLSLLCHSAVSTSLGSCASLTSR
jgi:hypothetical protein